MNNPKNGTVNLLFYLILLFGIVLSIPQGHAAQLKAVQSGTTILADGSSSVTAAITSVDTAKSFLVFGTRSANVPAGNTQSGLVAGQITNPTTLTFTRCGTTGDITIAWYIAEFISGVSVQRGNVIMNSTTENIALAAVNTAKSFPLISQRDNFVDQYDRKHFARAKITTSTNLQISLNAIGASACNVAEWQVVEYADAVVQTGEVSFGTADISRTEAITNVDTSKSWLFHSYTSDYGSASNIGQKLIRGTVLNSTTLVFDRDATGQTVDLSWYLVEFTDATTVQHSTQSFTSSETQKDVPISSAGPNSSIVTAAGYYLRGGKTPYSSASNPFVSSFNFDLTSPTNLRITRGITGSATADVGWFVVHFPSKLLDCNYNDWCVASGDFCVTDEGGNDDFNSPARLDITRFGFSSNLGDRFYLLAGFDDTPPAGATAATLIDTDLDGLINFAYLVTVSGAATTVQLYSCDDTLSYGCGGPVLVKTYAPADYCRGTAAGPWNNDTFVEAQLPFSDLGFSGSSNIVLTSLVSYAGGTSLSSPKDSIFGTGSQNYNDRVRYDTSNGGNQKIPGAATYSVSGIVYADEGAAPVGAGTTVRLLVNGTDRGTAVTDADGGYILFPGVALAAGDIVLVYLDNDAAYQGAAVTVLGGIQIVTLDIYANHMIARQDNAAALSNANLLTAKGGSSDPDILYSVSGTALTVSGTNTILYLPPGHAFSPGGDVTAPNLKSLGVFSGGSGTIDVDGALTVTGGTFTATSGTAYVGGNLGISGAAFNHNSGTFIFDGTDAAINTGGAVLNNVTLNKTTSYTLAMGTSLVVSGALAITSGLLDQGASSSLTAGSIAVAADGVLRNRGTGSLTLGGDLSNSGRIDLNGGGDGTACGSAAKISIRSSVDGTQRLWSGSGIFDMVDLDVKDQAGSASITVYGGLNSGNNGANWVFAPDCTGAPTAVTLVSFVAVESQGDVLLRWRTGQEVNNLGFHVYREEGGELYRLTPDLIAGSALLAGPGVAHQAGRKYSWVDSRLTRTQGQSPKYWLEDIDLNGKRTRHGPVAPVVTFEPLPEEFSSQSLNELGQKALQKYEGYGKILRLKERLRQRRTVPITPIPQAPSAPTAKLPLTRTGPAETALQQDLAGTPAVKIPVKEEGWYRISIGELRAAGLSPTAGPRNLRLFAEGREVPLLVKSKKPGRLGPRDALEFYAEGLDTPATDTRVYWLVEGARPGKRLAQHAGPEGLPAQTSFPFPLDLKENLFYFAALKNGEAENFFGSVVAAQPVDKILSVSRLDPAPPENAVLELSLQGVTKGPHRVRVSLNQAEAGEVLFEGQGQGYGRWSVPQALLIEGENLISLASQNGDLDVSLIDSIRLTYWHTYRAQANTLRFSAQGGAAVTVDGFSSPDIRAVDITDPFAPYEIQGRILLAGASYSFSFGVPGGGTRALLAFTGQAAKTPSGLAANNPSAWHQTGNAYDFLILAHRDFLPALAPLKSLRDAQGLATAIIDVEDIYDEFSFGNKNPRAIRDFLARAKTAWNRPPRFVLLAGNASLDPRNYLGTGKTDFVPTGTVETAFLETASDDWFADFLGNGLPQIALGRLPVRTVEEASIVVAKIAAYEQDRNPENWTPRAIIVADENNGFDFEAANAAVRTLLPRDMAVSEIFRSRFSTDELANEELLSALDQGALLVNYFGHGSEELWGRDFLRSEEAGFLNNGLRLPFVAAMTCLNGYFHDVYTVSLAEALLKVEAGGAVSVWASSGLTEPAGQVSLNRELLRLLFGGEQTTLGEAAMRAKAATQNPDIRKTWILFGDPTTRLRLENR